MAVNIVDQELLKDYKAAIRENEEHIEQLEDRLSDAEDRAQSVRIRTIIAGGGCLFLFLLLIALLNKTSNELARIKAEAVKANQATYEVTDKLEVVFKWKTLNIDD